MGIFDSVSGIKGLGFLNNINFKGVLSTIGGFVLLIFAIVIVAGIVGFIYWVVTQKKVYNQKLHFFEEVNKVMVPVEDLLARELIIPNTNVKVFYIKTKDLYMPRGTKKMGKKSYWYAIRNNREIINFTMTNINTKMEEAGLDFDHEDMRLAYLNLSELIKRNYKDKSTKWWKEYKDVISTIIFVFVLTVAFFFIARQVGGLIGDLGPLVDKITSAVDQITKMCGGSSSGITPA